LVASAAQLASKSSVAILVLGDSQASCQEAWGERTGDRASLDLAGGQLALLEAVTATRVPTIVVLISGRPATFGENNMNYLLNRTSAILEAWRPGEEGGNAIVDVLFGDVAPSGKLPMTFPFSTGQIGGPSHPYYKKRRQYDGRLYTFEPHTPLFPFGFGLTYTTFEYSNISVSPSVITATSSVQVVCTVKNMGSRDGTDIAQLYAADVVGSVTRYNKQLVGFQRVFIPAGQALTVKFNLAAQELAFYDINMQYVTEPGEFSVWIGPDSSSGLQTSFHVGL